MLYRIATDGILHGGGRDDIMENNLMIRVGNALATDSRGLTRITNTAGDSWNLREKLDQLGYQDEPWRSRYPECAAIPNSWEEITAGNWRYPEGFVFARNLGFANGRFIKESVGSGTGTLDKFEEVGDNVADADPLFVDEASLDLSLQPGSPALAIPGWQPIPFAEIGVRP